MEKHSCIGKWSLALAIIALIISIIAIVFSCIIEPFDVKIETAIAVVTALMGICATFMVGWQIFSSINVSEELKNLKSTNEEFKKKVDKLDNLIKEQKEEIVKEREAQCLMKKELNAQLWAARALSLIDKQYFTSYECYAECLCIYLELQNYERIGSALKNMGIVLDYMNEALKTIGDYNSDRQKYDVLFSYNGSSKVDSENWPIKKMSSNPNFQLIKDKVEELEKRRLELNERVERLKQ
jgi:hypothetical protein